MDVSPGQYFQAHHYAAFDPPKPDCDDSSVRKERLHVREALLWLGERLWPFIQDQGWDLHRHRHMDHYTSSFHFVVLPDGSPIVDHIPSMWLHYGKSPDQLDGIRTLGGYDYREKSVEEFYNAFYLHTRIQIYISDSIARCWLMLATDKNYYDRSEFLKRLRKRGAYQEKFWDLIQTIIDKEFIYEIDDKKYPIKSPLDKESFLKFVRSDRGGFYSGIIKEYQPNDERISRDNIVDEMKENLKLLYPLYDLMAYRLPKTKSAKTSGDSSRNMKELFGGNVRITK